MITYNRARADSAIINVKLEGRLVGKIRPSLGGFRYCPINSRITGDAFRTLEACKASIEGTDEPDGLETPAAAFWVVVETEFCPDGTTDRRTAAIRTDEAGAGRSQTRLQIAAAAKGRTCTYRVEGPITVEGDD